MQLSVSFLASSLLACLSYLYERSSEINDLLFGSKQLFVYTFTFMIAMALADIFLQNVYF